jgi:hypothetical protein
MVSTYKMNTNELTSSFVSLFKTAHPGRKGEVLMQETEDETEHLLAWNTQSGERL